MGRLVDKIGQDRIDVVVGAASVGFGKALGWIAVALLLSFVVAAAVGYVVIGRALL